MTNYNLEYKKYMKYCNNFVGTPPSFYQYLNEKRQEAQDKRNYKRVQYYDEIISEEGEGLTADIELNNFND